MWLYIHLNSIVIDNLLFLRYNACGILSNITSGYEWGQEELPKFTNIWSFEISTSVHVTGNDLEDFVSNVFKISVHKCCGYFIFNIILSHYTNQLEGKTGHLRLNRHSRLWNLWCCGWWTVHPFDWFAPKKRRSHLHRALTHTYNI